jgi:toxin ParE1/3/4
MRYHVSVTVSAIRDIEDIHGFISRNDSIESAERVFSALTGLITSLDYLPERGNRPKELVKLGVRRFREIHFKPYRIIYWIDGSIVNIAAVVDGRRDMEKLLVRRLKGS